ncbi:universal stress protein [Halohasta litorea]|uniref:Universal stress protein n=1 Tax=Halohasta litorea TaxID=869891 RepID=A0ABD6D3C9_9EURY|nr:universal stress protein [Halohasta litorea]
MYNEILVATDGSDASVVAVDQALAVADRFGATVHLLHVVDLGTEMSGSAEGAIASQLTDTLDKMATEALDAAESRAAEAGVPTERVALEGIPHEAIVDYCANHGIDLVVLGSTGRSGITEHLMGSTTDRVARSVEVSVLIAR